MLEERIAELEEQLRAKNKQLQTLQDESHQYSQDLTRMEHTLNAKDDIIK
jgi:chromosome segregation ATPase